MCSPQIGQTTLIPTGEVGDALYSGHLLVSGGRHQNVMWKHQTDDERYGYTTRRHLDFDCSMIDDFWHKLILGRIERCWTGNCSGSRIVKHLHSTEARDQSDRWRLA
jgi:hypothetical protein